MRKICIIMLSIFVVFISTGCSAGDNYQEKATEFLHQYYKQYQQKDEIEKIFNFGNIEEVSPEDQGSSISSHSFEERIHEFIDQHFGEMLTENAKEILISNRLLPKADVLNTDIVKATLQNIQFAETENHPEENLSFKTNIELQHDDGSVSNISQEGSIGIVKEDGTLKVDGFKLY